MPETSGFFKPQPGDFSSISTASRIGLLTSLYFSQGLPYGFFVQALPVILRQQGTSLPDIGLANLLALPWALKFVWAPFIDRFGAERWGRRRSFIVPLQALATLIALLVSTISPTDTSLLLIAVLLTNLIAATQDVATDGLAVNLLRPSERGLGNGVQVAAYRLGMILGGGALLIVVDDLGWRWTFLTIAALLTLASLPILFHREAPSPRPEPARFGGFSWLKLPGALPWLLLLLLYKLGDAIGTAMVRPMLVDQGLGLADIGWLLGTIGSIFGLTGALLGGVIHGRVSRRAALLGAGVLQSVTLAGWGAVAAGLSGPWVALVCAAEHLGSGVATVTLFTAMMDASRRSDAGTDYTLQACAVVLATGLGAVVSGSLAEPLGYIPFFAASALLSLLGALAALWLAPPNLPPQPES